MITTCIMSFCGSFLATFIAVIWLFGRWDEEDMYDDMD